LVRQVVERYGGSIEVAGEGGAVFTVRLPVGRAALVEDRP
jgi:signal transduction histidine kinase